MNITWLVPAGAVAGVALLAIVVLHMRHRMPEVMTFPQLAFWPRVPAEARESPRWRTPPFSLLFLLQLLAALCLVLAFMRPAIPGLGAFGGQRTGAVQHIVVLDGSTSMLADAGNGETRWTAARRDAADILDDWQQGDRVTVIVASAHPLWKSAADAGQVDGLRAWLDDLPVPGGMPDQRAVSALLSSITLPDLDHHVTLITDGGLTISDDNTPVDRITVGDAAVDTGNAAIVASSVSPAGDGGKVIEATVLHDRAGTETLPWIVQSGSTELASGTVTLTGRETTTFTARIPPDAGMAMARIVTDDALPEDNEAFVNQGGNTLTGLRIALVSDVPGPTRHALEVLPGAVVETYPTTTPGIRGITASADLVVYVASAPAPDDMPDAPMLLIQPTGVTGHWQLAGVAPNPGLADITAGNPALRDIALDGVTFGETPVYRLGPDAGMLASGTDSGTTVPLIWRGMLEGQPYMAWAFDPSRSNIADRVTFPVLVAQTARTLAGIGTGGTRAPGDLVTLEMPDDAVTVRVTQPDGTTSTQPATGGSVTIPVSARPGLWNIAIANDAGEELDLGAIVVNTGDPQESRLSGDTSLPLTLAASGGNGTTGQATVNEALTGIWPLLVLAAVGVIVLEWWLWLGRSLTRRRTAAGRAS